MYYMHSTVEIPTDILGKKKKNKMKITTQSYIFSIPTRLTYTLPITSTHYTKMV